MSPQKAMATAPDITETVAKRNNLQAQFYNQPEHLSSTIDQHLTDLLVGLHFPHLSPPERSTVLDAIDDFLRLKIDIEQSEGVHRGS